MTLRRKIVALTLCLLLLFAMTTAASLLLQNKISEHFSAVVDDYLPLNAVVATIDVFTDRYELDLWRLAADLHNAGTNTAAIAQQGEADRRREVGVLTTTFQKTGSRFSRPASQPITTTTADITASGPSVAQGRGSRPQRSRVMTARAAL